LRAAHGIKEKVPGSMPNPPRDFVEIAPPTTKRIVGESANGVTEDKCHKKNDNKPEAKRAMEEEKAKLDKVAAENSKKAAKRKEQKKGKAEESKKAAKASGVHTPTDSDSEISEEESPVKKGAKEARSMRVGNQEDERRLAKRVKFGLHQELEGMLEDE
jgi:hypothetical protein